MSDSDSSDRPDRLSYASFGLAAISLVIAFVSFWINRPAAERKRDQDTKMRILATRSIVFWHRYRNHGTNNASPYNDKTAQADAQELEKALYDAVGAGLWTEIVGKEENSAELYASAVAHLKWASSTEFDDTLRLFQAPQHSNLFNGVARIINQCQSYKFFQQSDDLQEVLRGVLTGADRQAAWAEEVHLF